MLGYCNRARSGFSLIELMIVIAIFALVLLFGLPSFSEWSQNTQIRATAESIQSGLQVARSEAIRRNIRVEFRLSDSIPNQGATGWSVWSVNPSAQIQSKPDNQSSGRVTVTALPSGADRITFDGSGRTPTGVTTNADGTAFLTQINIDSSGLTATQSRDLRINLGLGGMIRMCDPNVSTNGDPRKC